MPRTVSAKAAYEQHCDTRWFRAPLSAEPAHRSLGAIVFKADGKSRDRRVTIGRAAYQWPGLIHGGLIAALADIAMGYSCGYQLGATYLVTIGLAVDYIGSAQIGQWLAVEPDVIKTGSTICFAQCFVKADDVVHRTGQCDIPRCALNWPNACLGRSLIVALHHVKSYFRSTGGGIEPPNGGIKMRRSRLRLSENC